MRIKVETAKVKVPASVMLCHTNFTSVAAAVDLYNETTVTLTTGKSKAVLLGEGSNTLPKDENHPIVQIILDLFAQFGLPAAGIELVCRNSIPQIDAFGINEVNLLSGILLVRALLGEPAEFDEKLMAVIATKYSCNMARFFVSAKRGAGISWADNLDLSRKNADSSTLMVDCAAMKSPQYEALKLNSQLQIALIRASDEENSISSLTESKGITIPVATAPLMLYALMHRPALIREVAQESYRRQLECPQTQKVHTASTELLLALQKAGWPALLGTEAKTVLIFTKIPAEMEENLKNAGFEVTPLEFV